MRVKSYNGHLINDGTNYVSAIPNLPGLPGSNINSSPRPAAMPVLGNMSYTDNRISLLIGIEDESNRETLRTQLAQWFDGKSGVAGQLIVTDDDGTSNPRYLMTRTLKMTPISKSGRLHWVISLAVDGASDLDGRMRAVTGDTDSWNITATGDTKVIANAGGDDAYPVYSVTPTSGKGEWVYKRWIPIRWRSTHYVEKHPLDISNGGLDTAALITAVKLRSDANDLRVHVGGIPVDYWLGYTGTLSTDSTTKVWINLNWKPKRECYLKTSLTAGALTEIEISDQAIGENYRPGAGQIIAGFPDSGILMIDNEAFFYQSRNPATGKFTGVTRAIKDTTAASHTANATIWLVQHDIEMIYGNSTAAAPDIDDTWQPVFDLALSSNSQWEYSGLFGEDMIRRPGEWLKGRLAGIADRYGGAFAGNLTNPWDVIGMTQRYSYNYRTVDRMKTFIGIWSPCGITRINITGGQVYAANLANNVDLYVASFISQQEPTLEYLFTEPSLTTTWQAITRDENLSYASTGRSARSIYPTLAGIYMETDHPAGDDTNSVEVSAATVYFPTGGGSNDIGTPTITVNAEVADNYRLTCTVTNNTTGDALSVQMNMKAGETVEIDTDGKTVTYLLDNSNQFQAMQILNSIRRDWLPLSPGNNTLKYEDDGTLAVTLVTDWVKRYYD